METLTEQTVRFAGRLGAAVREADRFDTGTIRGMQAAYDRLRDTLGELGLEEDEDGLEEPVDRDQATATAERLYHGLVDAAHGNHTLIRLAQTMNRVWAELTLSDGHDPNGPR